MNALDHLGSIAVIGMGLRFPGAKDPAEFWNNLVNGVESVSFFSDAELLAAGVDPSLLRHPNYVKAGAVLDDIDLFDAPFFGFSPREAEVMDPQHRLFLECSWEALESAGYNTETYRGQIGVFGGTGLSQYLPVNSGGDSKAMQEWLGNDKDYLTTRVSFKLNLKGPSLVVQSACSTSLVAVSLACQSLLQYQCDMALAGGVRISIPHRIGYRYEPGLILSPDGHCRAFDAKSQGTVFGNGAGIVVLKRLQEAVADGDCIHAVIRGVAINNDGALKAGYTAPGVEGQSEVVAAALAAAAVSADTIGYVEAHGTGTHIGDPIEVAALAQAFRECTEKTGFCALGSVKTNFGHLSEAAGVAGLIKTILALKHRMIPPTLHYTQPNPQIDFVKSPFYVNTTLSEWTADGTPRRAGVSSFGVGGTNAHVILEEAPAAVVASDEGQRPCYILPLSAKDDQALRELAHRYISFLSSSPAASLGDICFTAAVGRKHFEHRLALITESTEQARNQLLAFTAGLRADGVISGADGTGKSSKNAFRFTGQRSQYAAMARQLSDCRQMLEAMGALYAAGEKIDWSHFYDGCWRRRMMLPTYPFQRKRHWVDRTNPAPLRLPHLNSFSQEHPLLGARLHLAASSEIRFQSRISQTSPAFLQDHQFQDTAILPATAYVEMILAAGSVLFRSDKLVIRDFTIERALVLPKDRWKIVQVIVTPGESKEFSVQIFSAEEKQGIPDWTRHAFGQVLEAEEKPEIDRVNLEALRAQCTEEISLRDYYERCQKMGLQFGPAFRAIKSMSRNHRTTVGEIQMPDKLVAGGEEYHLHPILLDAGLQVLGASAPWPDKQDTYLPMSIKRLRLYRNPGQRLLSVAQMDREEASPPAMPLGDVRLINPAGELVAEVEGLQFKRANHGILPQSTNENWKDWLYEVKWKIQAVQLKTELRKSGRGCWLIFSDAQGAAHQLAALFEEKGEICALVSPGERYEQLSEREARIHPALPADYQRLLDWASQSGTRMIRGIVHLWSLGVATPPELTAAGLEAAFQMGCGCVLNLIQALGAADLGETPSLALVTRGAVSVGVRQDVPGIAQSPLWGMGKTIALEYPELNCLRVDLDWPSEKEEVGILFDELWSRTREDQVVFRGSTRHVGRLDRVRQRENSPRQSRLSFQAESTYLITGGFGGLGLVVAHWMAVHGARHLVLVGRSPASRAVKLPLAKLEEMGVRVVDLTADVSQEEQVRSLIQSMRSSMPPLRGIIHSAGVISDGVLAEQNPERFRTVMAPKVAGAWNLHTITRDLPLDFFVCFSSSASLLGSPGQANYVAANSFLDALAFHRRALGLPGISINWGPWSEVGLAAALKDRDRLRFAAQGIESISPAQGLMVLEELLLSEWPPQVGVIDLQWSKFLPHFAGGRKLVFFSDLGVEDGRMPGERDKLRLELTRASLEERQELLIDYIQVLAAKAMGSTSPQFDVQKDLNGLGLDSLMAVQLRNRISLDLAVEVPMVKIMDNLSIASLAKLVSAGMTGSAMWGTVPESRATNGAFSAKNPSELDSEIRARHSGIIDPVIEQVAKLSDAEVDALLRTVISEEQREL